MPLLGGWAMTAGSISEIVERVAEMPGAPRIVELGSGVSTIWLSRVLAQRGEGMIWAVDHDRQFLEETRRAVERDGSADFVTMVLAPLRPTSIDGHSTEWYDRAALDVGGIDVLVIDGPPGVGGPFARYPALPLLHEQLSDGALVLVDDTIRREERDIVDRWMQEHPQLQVVRRLGKSILLQWVPSSARGDRPDADVEEPRR